MNTKDMIDTHVTLANGHLKIQICFTENMGGGGLGTYWYLRQVNKGCLLNIRFDSIWCTSYTIQIHFPQKHIYPQLTLSKHQGLSLEKCQLFNNFTVVKRPGQLSWSRHFFHFMTQLVRGGKTRRWRPSLFEVMIFFSLLFAIAAIACINAVSIFFLYFI